VRVLDPARGRDLARLKAAAGSFSRRLVYAAALQVRGLEDEARAEWRALAELRPEDPVLKGFAR